MSCTQLFIISWVTLTVDGVTSAPAATEFLYVDYPTITGVKPSSIPANSTSKPETVTLTITGTGFVSGSTLFQFDVANGGALANINCGSSQCTATLTIPANATTMVTEPLVVQADGYTSTDSVNLTFPTASTTPILTCKGLTCS